MPKICCLSFDEGVDKLFLAALIFSVFTTIVWVVYVLTYIFGQLGSEAFSSLTPVVFMMYTALIFLPIWIIWQVFGLVHRYLRDQSFDDKMFKLSDLMKRNLDYTDLVARVLLEAEHEIKDGFIIHKFDVFVADLNELLAEIVQRCNVSSSMQMEQLWHRVKNGERWVIGKTLIEESNNYDDFSTYLADKAAKDSIFNGTLLEFCNRYQNLCALLEKHDRDRVFINILETGVLGKVYSILAPVAESVSNLHQDKEVMLENQENNNPEPDFVEKEQQPETSFWQKINPFEKSSDEQTSANAADLAQEDDDAHFFETLREKMDSESAEEQPSLQESAEPRLDISLAGKDDEKKPASNDEYAYPFGGWMNEDKS